MGLKADERTCEERECDSIKEAKECFEMLIESGAAGDLMQMMRAFFSPDHAIDPDQLRWQNLHFLMCRQPCGPAVGNNAEKKCVRKECHGGCNCECPEYEIIATGCDDPEQCNSYVAGWNYTALARAAEYAVSLARLPMKITDPRPGDILTWAPHAIPDNKPCDPCEPVTYGAWVNAPATEQDLVRFANVIDDRVDFGYIANTIQNGEHRS